MQAQRDPNDPENAIIGAFSGRTSIGIFSPFCFHESSGDILYSKHLTSFFLYWFICETLQTEYLKNCTHFCV